MGSARRGPREVNLLWLRVLLAIVPVCLFFSLMFYEDPARGANEPFDPFDPRAVRAWLWWGEPMTQAAWVGQLSYLGALVYLGAGFALRGRMRWRSVVMVLSLAGACAAAAIVGLGYLMATDAASFPATSREMLRILFFHAVAVIALAQAWWLLRRAARDSS